MTNPIAPMGFNLVGRVGGSSSGVALNTYCIPASDTNAYAIGDVVKIADGSDASGVPNIQKATGSLSEAVRGVIMSVLPVQAYGAQAPLQGNPLTLERLTVPSAKTQAYYVTVCDDPFAIYELQDDGLTPLTAAATNMNAQYTPTNPATGIQVSATVLATGTVAVTNTLPLKIIGLAIYLNAGGGNSFGAHATWRVMFNYHDLGMTGRTGA